MHVHQSVYHALKIQRWCGKLFSYQVVVFRGSSSHEVSLLAFSSLSQSFHRSNSAGCVYFSLKKCFLKRQGGSLWSEPYYQTTSKINDLHLDNTRFQIRWEGHIPGWNASA